MEQANQKREYFKSENGFRIMRGWWRWSNGMESLAYLFRVYFISASFHGAGTRIEGGTRVAVPNDQAFACSDLLLDNCPENVRELAKWIKPNKEKIRQIHYQNYGFSRAFF